MTVTSLPFWISSRARFQPTLPAPTIRTYMALSRDPFEADLPPHRRLEQLDGGLGGADGLEALLGVPLGARGVEHPHHHALHVEAAPGDLGDHQVGVVAVGGGHERVCLLDAGLAQGIDLEGGTDREAPAQVLPALVLVP